MKRSRQYTAYLLIMIICFSLLGPFASISAKDNTIHISTAKELIELSKKCTLDSWSKGKEVVLEADINLRGLDFTPIPIFSGTFKGNGHTIRGIEITGKGSYQGLFRYIEQGASVENLKVEATITPEGSRKLIGGIAGSNKGTLKNCTFLGSVSGKQYVGGLVGINDTTGTIIDCNVLGTVYGEQYIGGIAGENRGTLLRCVNNAGVNTRVIDQNVEVEKLVEGGAVLPNNTDELVSDVTDIGGISGVNVGIVQSCTNKGIVGYEHIGYNIGGIVGRQSGYIKGCNNHAKVYGRKDVGGIVGQMEPYTTLNYSKSKLDELGKELDTLQRMIQDAIGDGHSGQDLVSAQLSKVQGHVDTARSYTKSLADQTGDILSENVDTVNQVSATVAEAIDRLVPITDSLTEMATYMEEAIEPMEDALDYMLDVTDSTDDSIEALKEMSGLMNRAIGSIESALSGFNRSRNNIENAIYYLSIGEVNNAIQSVKDALDQVRESHYNLENAMETLKQTTSSVSKMADALEDANGYISKTIKATSEAVRIIEDAAHALTDTFEGISELAQFLADEPEVTFVVGDSQYEETKNNLSDALSEVSSALTTLNQEVSGQSHILLSNIQSITDQLFVVFDTMMEITEEITTYEVDLEKTKEDISQQDTKEQTEGKVANCINTGNVEGDLNVGGIAGAMSVDHSFDPEDDIQVKGNKSLNFIFQTRAIIRACQNKGDIKAKKDSVGGIVGNMKMGYVVDTTAQGKIVSSNGNYVGGIAGMSQSLIRSSAAKCSLEGASYIGGIAGEGKDIIDCHALVRIDSVDEYGGAIAGNQEPTGKMSGNFFVRTDIGGVDGISYAGKAEPLDYEKFIQREGIPDLFKNFTLKFLVDDKVVVTMPFQYGDSLETTDLPKVPQKEGYYGKWEDFDNTHLIFDQEIEAVYTTFTSTLESDKRQEGKMPILLVEGLFRGTDQLEMKESKQPSPTLKEGQAQIQQWTVTIPKDGNETHTLRYLIPDGVDNMQIYMSQDDKWVQIDTKKDGKYVVFEASGEKVILSIISTKGIGIEKGTMIGIAGILVVLIGTLGAKKIKVGKSDKTDETLSQ